MENAPGFDISINLDPLLVIPAILLLSAFTYFEYRYTIPAISSQLKAVLIIIRSVVLILILLLIFEPVIIRNSTTIEEPVNYIFVDNSSSIIHKDSSRTADNIKNTLNVFRSSLTDKNEVFLFGKNARQLGDNANTALTFSERFTSLESIVNLADSSDENITNIILITDGIINTGRLPMDRIENEGIPFNIVAVGDTSIQRDVQVKSIATNSFIYTDKQTLIEAVILNNGFSGKNINTELVADNKTIEAKNILLDESGINRVLFNYTPIDPGEVKLTIRTSVIPDEITSANNSKSIYKKVLNSKTKVGLISDSPSADFEFLKSAIEHDDNIEVVPIVSLKKGKTATENSISGIIDSLDILVLTGYPGNNTSNGVFNSIKNTIASNNTPFLVLLSPSTNISKLSELNSVLPFIIQPSRITFDKAQIEISDKLNSLLQVNSRFNEEEWLTLPPVKAVSSNIVTKAEAKVVAESRIKNIPTGVPLLITRSVARSRSIAVLAHEIWRWQLQSETPEVFTQLISNIIKWLKVNPNLQKFNVNTDKKIYSVGEDIEFSAELYDEKLAPILDAEIRVEIKSDDNEYDLFLSLNDAGKYTGVTTAKSEGDLNYTAEALVNGKKISEANGKISVEKNNPEMHNLSMDSELLHSIATISSGSFAFPENTDELVKHVNDVNKNKVREVHSSTEYKLWSHEATLIILVMLLSIEWFIRKRAGMM